MKRYCKPSVERRRFEQATLKRFAALGLRPADLRTIQALLEKGRRRPTDDHCDTLNREAQEKAGIELLERCLKGAPPESIIFRIHTIPSETTDG